jgi:hypothetical protein
VPKILRKSNPRKKKQEEIIYFFDKEIGRNGKKHEETERYRKITGKNGRTGKQQ